MKKNKLVQYRFCIKKLFLILIIASLSCVFTASFFVSDVKSIYADDSSKILICIDPGHGGKDTGTIGPTGLREKGR